MKKEKTLDERQTQVARQVEEVLERLRQAVKARGVGSVQRAADDLGKSRHFLKDWRRRNSIGLGDYLELLDYLGIDPVRFLRSALGSEERAAVELPEEAVEVLRRHGIDLGDFDG